MAENHPLRGELQDAVQRAWDEMVAESVDEPDIALIAAYVDGRLDEAETRRLGCHIRDCPAAWEILESLLPEDQPLPMPGEDDGVAAGETLAAEATVRVAAPVDKAALAGRSSNRTWQLAVAAGWLLAVALGASLWWADIPGLRSQLAQVEGQRRAAAYQLARAEEESLAQSAASTTPVFAIGDATPGKARVAFLSQELRGAGGASEDVQKRIDANLSSVREALSHAETPDADERQVPLRLIEVSSLIMAGRLDDANAVLVELEDRFPGNQVRNARAVWQLAAAEQPDCSNPAALKQQAAGTLREIAPDPPEAWMNLALYYLGEMDPANAERAAMEYLRTGPDPVVAQIVRQQFGLPSEDPR